MSPSSSHRWPPLRKLAGGLAQLSLLSLLLALPAEGAEVLVFPNGDRISGELIAEEDGLYIFESENAGRISVPVEDATLVAEGEEEVEADGETEAVSPRDPIVETEEGVALTRPAWTGRVDLGYTWQTGRADKNELSLRGQADRRIEESEYRAIGEFLYGEVEGERNTHRYLASFRWRESFTDRIFSETISLYEADRIREIRNRVEQSAGIGYRFLRSETLEGSIVPGFAVQYTDEAGESDRWDYLASLTQDFVWRINPQYRFEQDIKFLVDPGDTDDHQARFNAGIIGTMRDNINLSIRYQFLFENQTRPGVPRDDQRLITSVGYTF